MDLTKKAEEMKYKVERPSEEILEFMKKQDMEKGEVKREELKEKFDLSEEETENVLWWGFLNGVWFELRPDVIKYI